MTSLFAKSELLLQPEAVQARVTMGVTSLFYNSDLLLQPEAIPARVTMGVTSLFANSDLLLRPKAMPSGVTIGVTSLFTTVIFYFSPEAMPARVIMGVTSLFTKSDLILQPEAVPARVTLGVTSLLTLSTQHANSQKSLPPVSYIKVTFQISCKYKKGLPGKNMALALYVSAIVIFCNFKKITSIQWMISLPRPIKRHRLNMYLDLQSLFGLHMHS
jgi:hypothetical protein